jgi:hypothetical protein
MEIAICKGCDSTIGYFENEKVTVLYEICKSCKYENIQQINSDKN